MAELPPKIPNIALNWPLQHNVATTRPAVTSAVSQNPSWVDEFLDFSAARRGTHRRSVSDSIAFMEASLMNIEDNNCRGTSNGAVTAAVKNNNHHQNEFDKFDDEQFMSMFTDDIACGGAMGPTASSSNPSTPSDHNSFNDEIKVTQQQPYDQQQQQQQKKIIRNEPDEVESECDLTEQATDNDAVNDTNDGISNDKIVDPRRVKRILANRQSAQRSRVRKLQYISELERSVTSLQAEVSVLSPRVAYLDHQRLLLNVDNSALKQRIAALAQDKIFKDAHQEALRREIERLRQVYHQQQSLKKKKNNNNNIVEDNNNNGSSPLLLPETSKEPDNDRCTTTETKHKNRDQLLHVN